MKKLKYWWKSHNLPFITTATREIKMLHACHNELIKIDKKTAWLIVNPVIHSLKELRKNTWDVERVDRAIEWLEENFKFEEIKCLNTK